MHLTILVRHQWKIPLSEGIRRVHSVYNAGGEITWPRNAYGSRRGWEKGGAGKVARNPSGDWQLKNAGIVRRTDYFACRWKIAVKMSHLGRILCKMTRISGRILGQFNHIWSFIYTSSDILSQQPDYSFRCMGCRWTAIRWAIMQSLDWRLVTFVARVTPALGQ